MTSKDITWKAEIRLANFLGIAFGYSIYPKMVYARMDESVKIED